MKKLTLTIILIVLFTSLVAGCKVESKVEKAAVPVKIKTVEIASSSTGLRYSASIIPRTQVDLAFKVGGYVDSLYQVRGVDGLMRDVQQGDLISKGTLLARVRQSEYQARLVQVQAQTSEVEAGLDSSKAQVAEAESALESSKAQLAEATAGFEDAKIGFNRASSLLESYSITKAEYDKAKTQYDLAQAKLNVAQAQVGVISARISNAKAQVDSIKARIKGSQARSTEALISLEDTTLRSPIDGVVIEKKVEVGTMLSPSVPVFVVADTKSVKAVFGVPDLIVKDLELGSFLPITSEAVLGAEFKGQITAISPAADLRSRAFEVEVTIANPEALLKVGMIVSLVVEKNSAPLQQFPVVPINAIVRSKGATEGYSVFVVQEVDGKQVAQSRSVKLGETFGNTIAIIEGLKPKESVITTGATLVLDGDKVQIIP